MALMGGQLRELSKILNKNAESEYADILGFPWPFGDILGHFGRVRSSFGTKSIFKSWTTVLSLSALVGAGTAFLEKIYRF
jgi:hypothetical protein